MHTGSCLCGAIEYEITGALGAIMVCHCSRCRKASGSAFNAMSPVAAAGFRIVKGQEQLRDYRNDAGVHRLFCGTCGAQLFNFPPCSSKGFTTSNFMARTNNIPLSRHDHAFPFGR